jgi:protein-glutamine gamma-glutamyltransferase
MSRRLADDRTFTSQRTAAVCLVLVQAAALWLLMEAPVFAICAGAIALAGWVAPAHNLVRAFPLRYAFVVIGFVFGLKSAFAPAEFEFRRAFINTPLAYEIACFCIVIQLVTLFAREYVSRLPIWLLGVSVIGLIFASDVRLTGFGRTGMLMLVPLYVVAWIAFAASSRRPVAIPAGRGRWFRMGVMALVTVTSLSAGTAGAVFLREHERELEQAIAAYLALSDPGRTGAGFSGRGGLSDISAWKSIYGEQITLQVASQREPGYLRGRVFDYFRGDVWRGSLESRPLLRAEDEVRARIPGATGNLFLLKPGHPGFDHDDPSGSQAPFRGTERLTIWPREAGTETRLFLPLEAVAVTTPDDRLMIDQQGTPFRSDHEPLFEYAVWVGDLEQAPEDRTSLEELLQLPEELHPDVRIVAAEIFEGTSTSAEKMRAVVSFFQDNFEYQLGVRIPGHADRLAWFLTHKPPAHCEYFATATAILLRLEGIPTRYVTGFHVNERNHISGNWIARRRDAHAWVEAYDEQQRRWVIVESTPPAGVPAPAPASLLEQLQEAGAHAIRQGQELLRQGDWFRILQLLLTFIGVLVGVILLGHGGWRLIRYISQPRSRPVQLSERDTKLIRERRRMDRFLARRGIRRSDGETVLQFAGRIESARNLKRGTGIARWYHHYLTLRFGSQTVPDHALHELRTERRRLTRMNGTVSRGRD